MLNQEKPAPTKSKPSRTVAIGALTLGLVVIICGAATFINYAIGFPDRLPSLATAMGGTLTALAIIWPWTKRMKGRGSLHLKDIEVGRRIIGIFGVIATLIGVLLDSKLGIWGLGLISGAGVLSFFLFSVALFGLAPRRQRLEDNKNTPSPAGTASESVPHPSERKSQ